MKALGLPSRRRRARSKHRQRRLQIRLVTACPSRWRPRWLDQVSPRQAYRSAWPARSGGVGGHCQQLRRGALAERGAGVPHEPGRGTRGRSGRVHDPRAGGGPGGAGRSARGAIDRCDDVHRLGSGRSHALQNFGRAASCLTGARSHGIFDRYAYTGRRPCQPASFACTASYCGTPPRPPSARRVCVRP